MKIYDPPCLLPGRNRHQRYNREAIVNEWDGTTISTTHPTYLSNLTEALSCMLAAFAEACVSEVIHAR